MRERIGMGGMGVVYKAVDTELRRAVAIKVPRRDTVERLTDEARAAALINHPGIATIYSVERTGRLTYLVMELVSGETLREIVDRGALPIETATDICVAIADAVAAAHRHGLVHLDLKPDNIAAARDSMRRRARLPGQLDEFFHPGEQALSILLIQSRGHS